MLKKFLQEQRQDLERYIEKTLINLLKTRYRYATDQYLTTEQLCKEWNISTRTLARYRSRDEYKNPLPYYQFGRQASYKWSDCLEFSDKYLRIE